LTDQLRLTKEQRDMIDELIFLEEINQPTRLTKKVYTFIDDYESNVVWEEHLTRRICKELKYGSQEYFWQRMLSRAEKELKYGHLLHAIVLAYEALLVKIVLVKELKGEFPRGQARNLINKGALGWEKGYDSFLRNFGFLRNTIVHGDQPMNGYVANSIEKPEKLEEEIRKGIRIVWEIFEDGECE
jgi:hypothetical protein